MEAVAAGAATSVVAEAILRALMRKCSQAVFRCRRPYLAVITRLSLSTTMAVVADRLTIAAGLLVIMAVAVKTTGAIVLIAAIAVIDAARAEVAVSEAQAEVVIVTAGNSISSNISSNSTSTSNNSNDHINRCLRLRLLLLHHRRACRQIANRKTLLASHRPLRGAHPAVTSLAAMARRGEAMTRISNPWDLAGMDEEVSVAT